MDLTIKSSFIDKWDRYFPGGGLPIACFYSDELRRGPSIGTMPRS